MNLPRAPFVAFIVLQLGSVVAGITNIGLDLRLSDTYWKDVMPWCFGFIFAISALPIFLVVFIRRRFTGIALKVKTCSAIIFLTSMTVLFVAQTAFPLLTTFDVQTETAESMVQGKQRHKSRSSVYLGGGGIDRWVDIGLGSWFEAKNGDRFIVTYARSRFASRIVEVRRAAGSN